MSAKKATMDHERSSPVAEERPQKRQRILACRRCRGRKQKCEDKRPCSNCVKSGDECVPTEPAPRPHVESEYVRALEERIAELESHDVRQSQDHALSFGNGQMPRRLTQSSAHSTGANGRHMVGAGNPALLRDLGANRRTSEGMEVSNSGDFASVSPANMSAARRSYSHQSPSGALSLAEDSDSGLDHLMLGLGTSPSAHPCEAHAINSGKSPAFSAHVSHDGEFLPQSLIAAMPQEVEDLLLNAYRGRAQAQYPFLHWPTFMAWHADWKNCPPGEIGARSWQGFFVNLVYSTALLLLSLPRVGQSDARTFYRNGVSLLPAVYEHKDEILSMQSYLLLSVHSLHKASTPRVLSLTSLTMRYCVQSQFHLCETEPAPVDVEIRFQNQVRRRCFWSAYCMDRLVMASFELPPSVSDVMITAKLYANIDDEDLEQVINETALDIELPDSPVYTCVSSSLHILQCRRIQSEISNYTLRWDYKEHYESSLDWRIRILSELENYKARVQNFSDPQAKGHTSQRWLAMIYHYTLLTLYRPTKDSVLGPAGDWSIQASSQACLMFRKSQMDRQIAQAWLGLLVQFQSGVTLLYCCWATPPEYRTENYDSPDVSDALRACSNILAIMADRWPKADCLRDVFELLAREVPLVDRLKRPPTHISQGSVEAIREKLPQVRALVVHRSIMRMIEEMVTDDFPRLRDDQSPPIPSQRVTPAPSRERPASTVGARQVPTASPAVGSFELPFTTQMYGGDPGSMEGGSLNPDELLAFPGMFDLNTWT